MKKSKVIAFLNKWKLQFVCITMGFVLFFIAQSQGKKQEVLLNNNIRRGEYGEFDNEQKIYINGLDNDEVGIDISVSKREYSDEQLGEVFEKCIYELQSIILNGNSSLQEVEKDLKLVTKLEKYGIKVKWESADQELIDILGKVYNENLKEPVDTTLEAELRYKKHTQKYEINLRVIPKIYTEKERNIKEFSDYIATLDKEQVEKENLSLPTTWKGKKLKYRSDNNNNYSIIWILGIIVAILLHLRKIVNSRTVIEKRSRQLMEDYPEIVSKFMILTGAGMSIRSAWENIVNDYNRYSDNKKEQRFAYIELEKALGMLKTGVNESKVFKDFGRNTGQKQYMKLASLFEQNKKAGNAGLKNALTIESLSAWEERLSMAKRMGEEASTKLLGPLFIMLGIVMLMVMAPAMMSFYLG